MLKMTKQSYTAASIRPVKLYLGDVFDCGGIRPVHVQLNPTNRCNKNCHFCSCKNRDKSAECDISEYRRLIPQLYSHGCRAITITGGGEPLMHPHLDELIHLCSSNRIDTGLVTNGLLLSTRHIESLSKTTWCRISCSGSDENIPSFLERLKQVVPQVKTDWAFSYVLDKNHMDGTLRQYIDFANEQEFTHVRVVHDLLSKTNYPNPMLAYTDMDLSRVIYQPRKEYTKGAKQCFVSRLRPNIDPNGNVFPCCGIQYALEKPSLDYDKSMCMGSIQEYLNTSEPFDGSVCARCYYSEYNIMLKEMSDAQRVKHEKFV